jgi:hypothetical protein
MICTEFTGGIGVQRMRMAPLNYCDWIGVLITADRLALPCSISPLEERINSTPTTTYAQTR